MEFTLPKIGKAPISFPHFPTKHQAFIFRAYEYCTPEKIAGILGTTAENVIKAAEDMGLTKPCDSDIWLKKGYITIIRSLWHILPYEQLIDLLETDTAALAQLLREEDFLDIKLEDKPDCELVAWRELTAEEAEATKRLKEAMQDVDMSGVPPFEFSYEKKSVKFLGEPLFDTRLVYGFSSLYQNALEVESETYCPDELLEAYQASGVNKIWIPATLHSLTYYPFAPNLSEGYEERLARLRRFTERCAKYDLGVMLYISEPRSLPESFFEEYPHLKGHKRDENTVCLCTSTKEVQDYVTNGMAFICKEVPKLGGVFIISRSENTSNCYSHSSPETCNCPRCSKRSVGEVIGEVIGCIEKGAHSVNPELPIIVWSWSWNDENLEIIEHLPQNIILMSNSEDLIPTKIGGVDNIVQDYSMSIVGPGEKALAEWELAKKRGLELAAKVQVNTTWECSTIPALPVYQLVEQHMQNLQNVGVKHLMLSWTLGGYPSANIRHAAKYFNTNVQLEEEETPQQREATQLFSDAFQNFPFNIRVVYRGPQNGGVSNLLYTEPTGYRATMTCYAYDDLERWRDNFPEDVFEEQFAKLCTTWEKGLDLLEEDDSELSIMAHGAYCQFKASLNQIRFRRARDRQDVDAMVKCAQEEIVCAKKMLQLMNKTAAIGFEAANHYYYSKGNVAEKIVNCRDIIYRLTKSK